MIQITTVRQGLHCLAYTVKDNNEVCVAMGLTQEAARRRLLRDLDREWKTNA